MRYFNVITPSSFGPMLVNRNDTIVGRHITELGSWEQKNVSIMHQVLDKKFSEPVDIIDAGANIGVYSLAFCNHPKVRSIHAVEVQRPIFQILNANIAINSVLNVHTHLAALSNASGDVITINIPDPRHASNFGAFEVEMPAGKSDFDGTKFLAAKTVRTMTIDDLALVNCGFIKLDIEGMELRALLGAAKTLSENRPILFFERHKTDYEGVRQLLSRYNYHLQELRGYDVIATRREWNLRIQM